MTVGSLFSGIGGIDLGLQRAGMTIAWQCEIDPWCRRVLAKHWPAVPRVEDVRDVNATSVGRVDLIAGGFPCQDISVAGRGEGLSGARSGLWREYARVVGELRPRYVLVENVAALLGRGLGEVLGDLAALGYDAEWHCIPAASVGAHHLRDRLWIVAHRHGLWTAQQAGSVAYSGVGTVERGQSVADTQSFGWQPRRPCDATKVSGGRKSDGGSVSETVPYANGERCEKRDVPGKSIIAERLARAIRSAGSRRWVEPELDRVAHGVPHRVDRLRGLGNAVVPQVVELIGRALLSAEWVPA